MNYTDFFNRLKAEDARINFNILEEKKKLFRDDIPSFYQVLDPLVVEFEFNDGIVRLIPYEELEAIQDEYKFIEGGCVFAICNGEPIYYKKNKVWTCICGKDRVIEEEIASSIDSFFEQVN